MNTGDHGARLYRELSQGPAFSAVNFAKFRGTAVKKFENSAVIPR